MTQNLFIYLLNTAYYTHVDNPYILVLIQRHCFKVKLFIAAHVKQNVQFSSFYTV